MEKYLFNYFYTILALSNDIEVEGAKSIGFGLGKLINLKKLYIGIG